jgi:hypothetical protein
MGRLRFTLAGSGPHVEHLHDELSPVRERADAPSPHLDGKHGEHGSHLVFEFVDALPRIAGHTASKPITVLDDSYRVAHRGLSYHVSRLHPSLAGHAAPQHRSYPHPAPRRVQHDAPAHTNGAVAPLHIAVRAGGRARKGRLSATLEQLRDPGFLSPDEKFARAFMYDVFDHLSQTVQLPLGQTYIHASSVERDGEGTAIIAWSEVGKTAALVKLVTEHGFRFLSDDVALVDDAGMLWRTPKLIQLKGINVSGEERLHSMLLDGRSALDRFSWTQRRRRHGDMSVRRRVSAERFFGTGAVSRNAKMKRVFCLERADVPDFQVEEIGGSELCRRAGEMMTGILEPFGQISRAIHSGHRTPILPTRLQMREDTDAVLRRAFDSVPAFNVLVPLAARPASLASYLVRLIESSRAGRGRRWVSADGG